MTAPSKRRPSSHCPGCRATGVPPSKFACRSCWYRLPKDLRQEITQNYRRHPEVHLQAVMDALRWYRDNPVGHQPELAVSGEVPS